MRRHVSDLAWRPIIKGGDIDEIVVAMGGNEEAGIDSVGGPRRSASAYFQPNSISSMSRESTLKSSQGSLGVFLSQAVVEPDDSDGVSYEDSGFTSVRGAFARQSTSNSLQIPGETAVLKVAEPEDSETLSEVETFPNYDSSDGEIVASRDPSRNHSLTSSGISSNRASLTPTKTNIGTTLKQLLTSSRSNSRDKPKIMITRVPTIDQSDVDFVYGDDIQLQLIGGTTSTSDGSSE